MSYGSEKLKELGVERIHNDTHISLQHINIVLNEEFSNINKVQFMGFVSILEREYDIDLSDIRENGLEYYKSDANTYNGEPGVFVVAGKHKTFKYLYLTLAFIVFLFAVYFTLNFEGKESSVIVENNIINEVKKNIEAVQEVVNESEALQEASSSEQESLKEEDSATNNEESAQQKVEESTQEIEVEVVAQEQEPVQMTQEKSIELSPLVVVPKSKLWIGYIDITNNEKHQKIITEPLVLDGYKKWLLFLGHGNVNIEANGVVNEYNSKKSMRFAYKEGKFKEVSKEEFKSLNRGSKW